MQIAFYTLKLNECMSGVSMLTTNVIKKICWIVFIFWIECEWMNAHAFVSLFLFLFYMMVIHL